MNGEEDERYIISKILNTIGLFLFVAAFMFPVLGKPPFSRYIFLQDLFLNEFWALLIILPAIFALIGYAYRRASIISGLILILMLLILSEAGKQGLPIIGKIVMYGLGFYLLLGASLMFILASVVRK